MRLVSAKAVDRNVKFKEFVKSLYDLCVAGSLLGSLLFFRSSWISGSDQNIFLLAVPQLCLDLYINFPKFKKDLKQISVHNTYTRSICSSVKSDACVIVFASSPNDSKITWFVWQVEVSDLYRPSQSIRSCRRQSVSWSPSLSAQIIKSAGHVPWISYFPSLNEKRKAYD